MSTDGKLLPGQVSAESVGKLGGSSSLVVGIVGFLVGVSETSGGDWGCWCDSCGDTLEGSGSWDETGVGILLESQDSACLDSGYNANSCRVVAT